MSEEFEKWWRDYCRYLVVEEMHKADFLFKGACQRAFAAGIKAASTPPTYAQGQEEMRERAAKVCDPYTHGQWFADAIRALPIKEGE